MWFGSYIYFLKGKILIEFLLFRYEGEWLQNNPDGHGVVEVDIPDIEPVPGSKYVYHLLLTQWLEIWMVILYVV